MSKITLKAWEKYINLLSKINTKAVDELKEWLNTYGEVVFSEEEYNIYDILDGFDNTFIDECYQVVQKYGNASAAVAAEMYDAISEMEKANVPPAEMAELASYGDIAKTVNGVLKTSRNAEELTSAVARWVKKASCDTTLKNAYRDRAQYAWIPHGDTCAYCMSLAAIGWVNISEKKVRQGYPHAEHIHSNCDCNYAIRHTKSTYVAGYDDKYYQNKINNALIKQGIMEEGENGEDYFRGQGGWLNDELINAVRRENYAQNSKKILEQKASAYEKRKELNSSKAEEENVN